MFSFAIARRQLSVFLVFKSSKWVVNCSKQSQKVLENQEFPGFDSVLPWQIKSTRILMFFPPKKPYFAVICRVMPLSKMYKVLLQCHVTLILVHILAYHGKIRQIDTLIRSRNVVKIRYVTTPILMGAFETFES